MDETLWLYLLLPIVLFIGWGYTAVVLRNSLPVLRNKAIVLLVAHPDDEAMFFAPTVLALTRPELGNHLKILCLSNGNADGLGAIRQHEIVQSGLRLGLRSASDVMVLDSPSFIDSMTRTWSASDISSTLDSFFLKKSSSSSSSNSSGKRKAATTSSSSPPETSIDALITFDAGGVSSHPNHISLYHGATVWARGLVRAGYEAPVRVYALTSVNMARKYAGAWDAPFTLAWNTAGTLGGGGAGAQGAAARKERREWPHRMAFVNDVGQWITSMGAMVNAHKSQMVWFRWGWITMGRYMVVNDLRRVKL